MVGRFLAKLKQIAFRGERRDHVSVLLPFLIISAGLGVLAWRSYQLSLRMEQGANTLAINYANYAAEITAKRVDAATRAEFTRAADEWQGIEKHGEPTFAALRDWVTNYDWIVSAIYVPDFDPASSIYVSEIPPKNDTAVHLSREFFTSSGTVRYEYDAARLLARVHNAVRLQPLVRADNNLPQRADVVLVTNIHQQSLQQEKGGFAYFSPLSAPLDKFGVRAAVRTSYIGSGWENQRVISLWVTFLALLLTAAGAYVAWRSMKKEAETMNLRGALIANVSHELRTPLAMIRLGAETLKHAGPKLKEKERFEIEEQILREVLHLSHLVENVLDIARIQHRHTKALAFTPVQPQELVRSLVSTYESWIRSKGFAVTVTIDETVEEQMWDREAVSRALLNLIDNAIKYSADDKRIDVVLSQTPDHIVLGVHDHGIGIDAKDATKIFDPYYRAQFSDTQTRRGAGLGLTLVQQIIASHGGTVEVDSEPGNGSTFRLKFPRGVSEPRDYATLMSAREAF
ncbi:MAG TPA: HAMP domain-containing sensor histidine kinase [Thermoanaerobaculia bacterium]|nr:HAMP domain-containing sensor histidine kinase [Thermoanaerobaculia bacterium]